MRLSLLLEVISCLCLATTTALAISWSKPDCQEKCGNVTIPYPFGIGSGCSLNSSFTVLCLNSTNPSRPLLSSINMEALEIIVDGRVRVKQSVSPLNCSDVRITQTLATSLVGSPFTISAVFNSLAVLGCRNMVWLRPNRTSSTIGGCKAICDKNSKDTNCNGVNCCQTTIPPSHQELQYTYQTVEQGNNGSCGYAFPVDKKWFQDDYKRYRGLRNDLLNPFDQAFAFAPLVLEWEVDTTNLEISQNGYCSRHPSSSLISDIRRQGYCRYSSSSLIESNDEHRRSECRCEIGYEGNPYLPGGCTDIDECNKTFPIYEYCRNGTNEYCNTTLGNYCMGGTCINSRGSFTCHYPRDEIGFRVRISFISIGSGVGALTLLIFAWRSTRAIRKRIKANRKRKFFKKNGGLLLEQHFSSTDKYGVEKTKLFSSKELAQATDHYNENRVLGHGGQGTVYKGMLTDGRIVAVKRSKSVHEDDLEVFINEVVILSQINHRNIVKLLGCCLETEVPLLVYEFIPNGTLFQHIHEPSEEFPLSWEMRLRIAKEAAGALSYLHYAASAPIYHRDIKSTNILLDDKYRAKISDFGTSRSVAIDQTHLTTRVLGTFGYLDPEYFQSSQFTEKSDVYSFGVVMVELLTGEKAISSINRAEVGRSLATHFLESMEENQLFDIIDARVLEEARREEIATIAQLARRCLHLNGKKRPTMKEVASELDGIQMAKETDTVLNGVQGDCRKRDYHSLELVEYYDSSSFSGRTYLDTTTSFSPDHEHPLLY